MSKATTTNGQAKAARKRTAPRARKSSVTKVNGEAPRIARMEDVARRAGVSLMTVSRALRFPDTVADETRQRIEEASAALNYVGSRLAGQLATGRTRLVAVVLPDLRNPAFALAMQGLSDALGEEFELVVSGTHGVQSGEERVIRALLGYRPAALVVHGGRHDAATRDLLANSGIPVVEMGSLVTRSTSFMVGYSNRAAGRAATEHLIERGYRRIGFVSQPKRDNSRADERWQGFRAALAAAGIAPRPLLEVETELGFARGGEVFAELRERDRKLDAIFFTSDRWAVGALFHCQREGIAVPGDIAIMGFDDLDIAALAVPALTTIHVPRYEMGWESGKLLRAQIAGQEIARRSLDLGFELKVRETT